jgi:hypothetical protein
MVVHDSAGDPVKGPPFVPEEWMRHEARKRGKISGLFRRVPESSGSRMPFPCRWRRVTSPRSARTRRAIRPRALLRFPNLEFLLVGPQDGPSRVQEAARSGAACFWLFAGLVGTEGQHRETLSGWTAPSGSGNGDISRSQVPIIVPISCISIFRRPILGWCGKDLVGLCALD